MSPPARCDMDEAQRESGRDESRQSRGRDGWERRIDISHRGRSVPDHGRQISEGESKAKSAAKSESEHRDSEEERGVRLQGRAEKEVAGRSRGAARSRTRGEAQISC
jgi:hypothetical protein